MRHVHVNIGAVEKQYFIFRNRVFVILGTQHAMRMRHIVIRCLYGSIIFFHIIP
jgi:hypothetical protein